MSQLRQCGSMTNNSEALLAAEKKRKTQEAVWRLRERQKDEKDKKKKAFVVQKYLAEFLDRLPHDIRGHFESERDQLTHGIHGTLDKEIGTGETVWSSLNRVRKSKTLVAGALYKFLCTQDETRGLCLHEDDFLKAADITFGSFAQIMMDIEQAGASRVTERCRKPGHNCMSDRIDNKFPDGTLIVYMNGQPTVLNLNVEDAGMIVSMASRVHALSMIKAS